VYSKNPQLKILNILLELSYEILDWGFENLRVWELNTWFFEFD
jgi:hypothetical protein